MRNFFQTDYSEHDDGSGSEEDLSENELSPKAATSSLRHTVKRPLKAQKGKRKVTFDESDQDIKRQRVSGSSVVRKEKQHHSSSKMEHGRAYDLDEGKDKSKKPKKEASPEKERDEILWNESNCDVDLDDHAASNVHYRKIKISNNLILSCKMISHLENKNLHSDYAALVFSRKTNRDKMFNFLVDMRVTERLIKALQIIIEENPVFFNRKPVPSLTNKS